MWNAWSSEAKGRDRLSRRAFLDVVVARVAEGLSWSPKGCGNCCVVNDDQGSTSCQEPGAPAVVMPAIETMTGQRLVQVVFPHTMGDPSGRMF